MAGGISPRRQLPFVFAPSRNRVYLSGYAVSAGHEISLVRELFQECLDLGRKFKAALIIELPVVHATGRIELWSRNLGEFVHKLASIYPQRSTHNR